MTGIPDKFETFEILCRTLEFQNPANNGSISGSITITNENLDILDHADSLGLIQSGCVQFKTASLELSKDGKRLADRNSTVNLTLTIPKHAYQNWDELLSNQSNRLAIPNRFMIIEDNFCIFSHNDDHQLVNAYRDIVKLIDCLKSAADHENNATSFVYLSRSKLTIDIKYIKKDLENYNVSGFKLFTETMQSEDHATQKKYILQDTLFNMLLQIDAKDRFEVLLRRLQDFLIQFEHGYRLFITSFSFDNVRREYEEKYREYNGKLNTSINEVATKALATPITMLFSISNINSTSTAVSNYAIAIASILVSTFMIFLVRSNADNLQAIKDEYSNLFKRLASELASDSNSVNINNVEELKNKLDKRVTASQDLHMITMVSAIASSVFVIAYLFWLTW
ncbi:hypothetical protein [Aeromonas veronii]|uniref:hypothetical protein n=1 Tax=Aeromonas veronii TaxID=654 RepID=UPI003D1B663B